MKNKTGQNPFIRYLQSKKSVDDRSLNLRVWNTLQEKLAQAQKPIKILEIGGGIGTMLMRLLNDKILPNGTYTLLDHSPVLIDAVPHHVISWNRRHGYQVDTFDNHSLTINTPDITTRVRLVCADVFDFVDWHMEEFDLLIANAVLDLFDLPTALPRILLALPPGGLFYTTINYDGLTIFEPQFHPEFENKLLKLYNQSMDERLTDGKPSGDSRTGRHLFQHFKNLGVEILSAGSSDWVVFPRKDDYPYEEAEFLHHLIDTIQNQMSGHPEIDQGELDAWVMERKKQIDNGNLVCIVHQIDFLAAIPQK